MSLNNGVDNVLHLWVFMALIAGVILLLIMGKRAELKAFFRANARLLYVFAVTFVFSMLFNTGRWSHTYMELLSMLLIYRYLCGLQIRSTRVTRTLAVVVTIVFACQQIILARDVFRVYDFQHGIVQEYLDSPDGLMEYEEPNVCLTSAPYVRLWSGLRSPRIDYYIKTVYGHGVKTPIYLSAVEYKAVSEPESFFVEVNKVPGNAPVYKLDGGRWYWVEPSAMDSLTALDAELYPVDWNHEGAYTVRLKFALFSGSYPSTERLEVDTITTRYGRSYRIKPLPVRKIKAVNVAL